MLGLVLIRLLGLKNYGLFAMLWMGVLFALSLHQAFITKPLMTLAIGQPDREQQNYFHALWKIQLGFGSIILGLLIGIYYTSSFINFTADWVAFVPLMGLIAFGYLLQDYIKKTFFITKEYAKPLVIDSLSYGMIFIGLFYLNFTHAISLMNMLLVMAVGYWIPILLYSKKLFQKNTKVEQPSCSFLIKKHYHFSSWLLGTSILQWFSGNFFLIAAASTLGTTAVGAVRMAQNIVGLCHILFLAMENIVPAEAAQLFLQKDLKGLLKYLTNISLKIGSIVFVTLLAMAIAAPILIQLLYGADFITYHYVVWGYCLLYIFVFIGYPLRYFFRTLQVTKPIFIAYTISAVFSMSLAFPLVQHFGIIGLLAGLIISQLLTLIVYAYYLFAMTGMDKNNLLTQVKT